MIPERIACAGIDMDEVELYAALHGVRLDATCDPGLVHAMAGRRFGELCDTLGFRGTVFAVGRALRDSGPAAETVRLLHGAGHEVGNHTLNHDYRLTRLERASIEHEVREGAGAVREVTGQQSAGFRAPGYNVSELLFDVLERSQHTYDSSILPSLPYYVSRAAAIGALAIAGRRSASIRGTFRSCLASRTPYFPSPRAFWRDGGASLVELPLTTTSAGIPFIGTLITLVSPGVVVRMLRRLTARPFLNIGLHGLDFLDVSDGVPQALLARQPGLRVPAAEKIRRLTAAFARVRESYTMVRLVDAAAMYRRSARPAEAAEHEDDHDGAEQTEDRVHGLQR